MANETGNKFGKMNGTERMLAWQREKKNKRNLFIGFFIGIFFFLVSLLFGQSFLFSFASFLVAIAVFLFYLYFSARLKESARIRKIESIFPDFLQLMSGNLRAGMTIDRAMLLSSKSEFAPLDKEILQAGKDITTGKSVEAALIDMSKRINSEKINKTMLLIISGIRSGGNLAILLEQTSVSMRERDFVEKKAASSVMMYAIFIFIAVAIGAPTLFSLSNILVDTISSLLSGMPQVETSTQMPFTLSGVSASMTFIMYFSLLFMTVTNILASLILGLVSKGEEREGLKYLPIMLILSFAIFFGVKLLLTGFVKGLFG